MNVQLDSNARISVCPCLVSTCNFGNTTQAAIILVLSCCPLHLWCEGSVQHLPIYELQMGIDLPPMDLSPTTSLPDCFSVRKWVLLCCYFLALVPHWSGIVLVASSAGSKTSEGRLGECVVHWNVRDDDICFSDAVLQTWYQVRLDPQLSLLYIIMIELYCSIQSWALREAKERMEARGEKYQYEPRSSSSSSSS
jgi:hypothetical protein